MHIVHIGYTRTRMKDGAAAVAIRLPDGHESYHLRGEAPSAAVCAALQAVARDVARYEVPADDGFTVKVVFVNEAGEPLTPQGPGPGDAAFAEMEEPPTEPTPTYTKAIYKAPGGAEYATPVDAERCSDLCNDLIEKLINATAGPLESFIVAFMALKMLPHVVEALLKITPEQTADMVEEAAAIVANVHASTTFVPFDGKGGEG